MLGHFGKGHSVHYLLSSGLGNELCASVVVVLVMVVFGVKSSSPSKLSFFGFSSRCPLIIYLKMIPPCWFCVRKENKAKTVSNHNRFGNTAFGRFNQLASILIKLCLQECFLFIYLELSLKCMTSCFTPQLYCFISPIQCPNKTRFWK